MEKSQKAVSPSARGGPDANVGWGSIAPRRSYCKCSCTPLPNNFNTVMLHRAILLLSLMEVVPPSLTGLRMWKGVWPRARELRSHGNPGFSAGCTSAARSAAEALNTAANGSWPNQLKTSLGTSTWDVITYLDCTADPSSQRAGEYLLPAQGTSPTSRLLAWV